MSAISTHPDDSAHPGNPALISLSEQFNTALLRAKIRALEVMQQIMAPDWPRTPERGFCTHDRFKLARLAAAAVLRTHS